MINLLPWVSILLVSTNFCSSTLSNLNHHLLHAVNSSNEHLPSWLSEAPSSEHSQYVQTPSEFLPNVEGLLSKYYGGNRQDNHHQRNAHFLDMESYLKKQASPFSPEGRPDFRSSSFTQDHQAMNSAPDYDILPLKKHDFGGGQGYGGWDMPSGGLNFGHGSGLAQIGQAVKKGKEAKTLFILMAPLILLAVFGPILATQAMIPWVANGGLGTVTAVAGGGKRKKRSLRDTRQVAELEKRLQLFLEVQDFIAKTGKTGLVEEMGEAFLKCQKFSERRNKCLERVACEYNDDTSSMDPAERRIAKMVLQNVMSNSMIPASIKGRLSKGSMFGRNHRGRCRNYWCEAIDSPKGKLRT